MHWIFSQIGSKNLEDLVGLLGDKKKDLLHLLGAHTVEIIKRHLWNV